MKSFKYFIGGIVTVLFLIPLLNKLYEVIELWIDVLKIKPSKHILNYQKDAVVLNEFINQPDKIGDYEVEYMDDDDN